MTPSGYTEDSLIEQPAIALCGDLGWETFNAYSEFDHGTSALGRETKAEVVLKSRLRPALEKLNPTLPVEAIESAIEDLTRDRSRLSLIAANRELYELIQNGVRVLVPDPETDGERPEVVRVVDWETPSNNDFLLCSQFWVTGEMYTRRTDLLGFVNGLPLVFIELKASHKRLKNAYDDNLTDYKDTIPQIFHYNALIILSNGSESRISSVSAYWEHFAEWKKVGSESEEDRVSLETMLRGTCDPTRLLDIIENFTLFQDVPGGTIKLVAKNHQYLGVNNALTALSDIKNREGRLGVFWHTQGSGKSVSMIFFSQKVLRKVPGNWTFVVVTDRQELDGQIYKNFASAGAITEGHCQATSSRHLRELLSEDHRYVFTLIQKFRTESGETHPVLSDREDIIVITDEAHRSQYDTLALNMRTALPDASFLAFTGTPLIVGEEKTRDVFGEYISTYDFRQSVEDGATVRLFYENRVPELQIINPELNQDMADLLEAAELDDEQEKKLERTFAREYHLITRDDRLDAVAKDLVSHFLGRGHKGKAMMICIDKATAIRMYEKVRHFWDLRIAETEERLLNCLKSEREPLERLLSELKSCDMAVVVSQAQNEIKDMEAKGIDIRPHRKRVVEEDLESKFKDPDDPFRLVFVCAMWMTGFDVPSCSTLYLDKPMRNHTLMQTIARANRVYPGKPNGLIVDYANVFRSLEKALAIYGAIDGSGGKSPIEDKSVLVTMLKEALTEAKAFCRGHGVDLEAIMAADGFARIKLLDDALDALVAYEETKLGFREHSALVRRLYKAVLPDAQAQQFAADVAPIHVLAEKIKALSPVVEIGEVMGEVEELLDHSIAANGYVIHDAPDDESKRLIDLSGIDFEALKVKFEGGHKRTLLERLKGAIGSKLHAMVRLNKSRMDYLEKFQKMIDEYNSGSLNVEEFFKRLTEFVKTLDQEEQRAVGEQLSEEELALFDLLTKPAVELTAKERDQVKAASRELLETLKSGKLVLDWRKRQQARADVRVTIETTLDSGLPDAYGTDLYQIKSDAVFQHFYDNYFGAGQSVYSAVA